MHKLNSQYELASLTSRNVFVVVCYNNMFPFMLNALKDSILMANFASGQNFSLKTTDGLYY